MKIELNASENIIFFKKFELTDKELLDEVSKQFNITKEVAAKEFCKR